MNNIEKTNALNHLFRQFRQVDEAYFMSNPVGYRHKVIATFQKQKNSIVAGQYEPKSHKVIVSEENQLIEHPNAQKIIKSLISLIKSFKYDVFNEKTGYGLFRHVQLRFSYALDEIMVVLVVSQLNFPGKKNFARELIKKHPQITTVVLNENKRQTSVVLGEKFETLIGPGFILDKINNISFKISPASFYQVNPEMTQILYEKAIQCAELKPTDTVIDAYCGIGSIGLLASQSNAKIIGIEANKQAVYDARNNAKFNRIDNINFINSDATVELVKLAHQNQRVDVVFMDPPRDGSTKEFCESVVKLSPSRVVYVSCNPVTCVRDLKHFDKHYKVDKLILVDQFPHTKHIETIVLLSKLDSKNYISVELPMDDMDLTSAESKATYKQIQKYVLEKFGFKVSTLYIAQVKKKHGLEVREHYNISKNENQKVPQCSIEKEEAILDALKHFKML